MYEPTHLGSSASELPLADVAGQGRKHPCGVAQIDMSLHGPRAGTTGIMPAWPTGRFPMAPPSIWGASPIAGGLRSIPAEPAGTDL